MSKHRVQPPQRARLLFENLFVRREYEATVEVLSEGLLAVLTNAKRLIKDVELFVDAERYASAAILLAAADEEMAKSYILLDATRLDFSRHESVLNRLCLAFYSHVAKYAYNQIIRFPDFADMYHVKEMWDIHVTRWWPSDFESGEPDMPHATYFERELPLYVDFIDYDQGWFIPQKDTRRFIFEEMFGSDALSESKKALGRLSSTQKSGLYQPRCLSILNETFRGHYINQTTEKVKIDRLVEKTASRIESEMGIARQSFLISSLNEWPLYQFVTGRF